MWTVSPLCGLDRSSYGHQGTHHLTDVLSFSTTPLRVTQGALPLILLQARFFVACDARRDALTSALACARANDDYDFCDHHVSEGRRLW